MIDINEIAALYSASPFTVMKTINPRNDASDKRYVFLVKFDDGQNLAIKVCKNAFTTHERVLGWKNLSEKYLSLGIYCPKFINSLHARTSEMVCIDGETYIVYAEEMKKYKTYDELDPKPDFERISHSVLESIGLVAANCTDLLAFPSVYCLYTTFDETDEVDENYQNAESFCKTVKKHFPKFRSFADQIWDLFLQKRKEFEPVHALLPRASFQSDLNPSNILVDENNQFAGYIDFNLSGTETVLGYIVISEICGYRLKIRDLDRLHDKGFIKMCDEYFYRQIKTIEKHYTFSDFEKTSLGLCYNTVYPFSCWSVNALLEVIIKEEKTEFIKPLLDWVHFQLCREDIGI